MEEEMESLRKKYTWDVIALPDGRRVVGGKLVFKKRKNAVSHIENFKARLEAKGYSQVEGVDFNDIFSLVAKLTSIRLLMYLATKFYLEIEKMNVKK